MSENKRNIGIDLLRIFSMFMIVTMHLLKQGGLLAAVDGNNSKCYTLWLVEVLCFCAVDCYALISGYVGVKAEYRISKLAVFWLQIAFYTVLITAYFALRVPGSVNLHIWWKAVFPVLTNQYWYMSCYFGLLIFAPFLNEACRHIKGRQLGLMVGVMVLLFSVMPCVLQGYPFNFAEGVNPFGLGDGFSVLWLIVLYIIGAYIRQEEPLKKIKTWVLFGLAVLSVVVTWGWIFLMPMITVKRFGEARYGSILLNYTSPTILLVAVCFLTMFSRLRSDGAVFGKTVRILSGASLGVYLIHVHPLVWEYYLKNCVVSYAESETVIILLKLLATAVGIYLVCSAAELLRRKLFEVLKVEHICRRLLDKTKFN